jgi:hypothetical protein
MAWGRHGLPKVSLRPDPTLVHPEMASRVFQGWPTDTAGGLRPSPTLLDTPRRTPIVWSNRAERTEVQARRESVAEG